MVLPLRIEVIDGTLVEVEWDDGKIHRLAATDLRRACMCAVCREPSGEEVTAQILAGPQAVTITETRLVGGYAITFTFGPDGHGTGIYPYTALRSLGEAAQTEPTSNPG